MTRRPAAALAAVLLAGAALLTACGPADDGGGAPGPADTAQAEEMRQKVDAAESAAAQAEAEPTADDG
ncbi:hypothetical protein ACWEQL_34880 [Kitasatospora sp. NPDC004240]